jgi:hypothetical protein
MVGQAVATPISDLINKSMSEGVVPDALKIAKIVPIHKSKAKDIFSNYRLISILITLGFQNPRKNCAFANI